MSSSASQQTTLRRGQAAVSLRARPGSVARALLKQTPVLSIVTALPCLAAAVEQERDLAAALLLPTTILGALGLWSREITLKNDLRRIEAVATLAFVFVICALICLPAFLTLGMSPLDAFFEATSGITTTGLSVAQNAQEWPVSAHFLRAWLQWCGGVVVAVAGVALLMDSGRAAHLLGEQSVGGSDYLASTRTKARVILVGYAALTVGAMVVSVPLFPGWWEGPVVVLAAVSTGGFTPRADSLADYSRSAQVFTLLLCLATSVSLVFYALARKHGPRFALSKGTVKLTLMLIAGSVACCLVLHGLIHGWEVRALTDAALNQISAHTTAGFSTVPVVPTSPMLFLMILAMMIGGDAGSTTGGIKTGRIEMLARMVSLIFLRLRLPDRAVSHLKIGDRRADAEAILFAPALLAIYLVSAGVFWLALYAGGYPALPALYDAISALSGVGLSAGVIGPDLEPALKGLALVAMLLGRLEFFALIVVFLPSTWISRR